MNEQELQLVKEALDKAVAQKKISEEMLKNLGPAIIDTLRPILEEMSANASISKQELADAISQIKITIPKIDVPHATVDVKIPNIVVPEPKVNVTVPPIEIPTIKIPAIKVPKPEVTVNVPPIKIPDLKWPQEDMPIKGWVGLMGVDLNNPLPVQLRDHKGNPVNLFENLTALVSQGGGGGKQDYFTIKGFSQSAYSSLTNADGRLRVSVETGGSGLTDSELRASSVPVEQVSGSLWSTQTKFIARTTNPTAIADGSPVFGSADKLGRQLTRIQARDLVVTAYASLTTGTETTLVSGVAGSYLDLVYIMGANNSDAAVTVDIRPVTAGNIVMSLQIPASGIAGIACPMPFPQGDTGNNWTADMSDITGTTVSLTALFSKEV